MNILTVIPARYASVRFPGKPLALLGGKPLVQWVYERAKSASEHVVIATDDERIAEAVNAFGGVVEMTSSAHPSGTDRCLEAATIYAQRMALDFDVLVNVQGDEPFITGEQIKLLTSCFLDQKVDIATLVSPLADNWDSVQQPNNVKVVLAANGKALYFSRSIIPFVRDVSPEDWAKQHVFYHHLGMYAYRFDVLRQITRIPPSNLEQAEKLEQLRWLENGYNIYAKITQERSIGIDTPEDLATAEKIIAQ